MHIDLMDEIANTQREYVKARLKAEKTRDPEAVKKIKQAQMERKNELYSSVSGPICDKINSFMF